MRPGADRVPPVAVAPTVAPAPVASPRPEAPTAFSIADAVRAAAPHDTVRVPAGTYREQTVVIDRPLVLLGIDRPVLDGEGARGLLEVTADSVTVRGFIFRNTGITFMDDRAALRVSGSRWCAILDNAFEETFFGAYFARAEDCVVAGNTFRTTPDRESNGGNGVHSWYSRRLLVEGNRVSGHRDGIYLEFTEDSRVVGNVSTGNTRYGLHFMFSDRCSYERNRFERNGAGVAVMYAHDVEMRGNDFLDTWGASAYGLLLKEIKGGSVAGNTFARNSVALFVEGTDRMTFDDNRFEDNGWAIKLMANATQNDFRGNSFRRNTFDVATNSRSATSRFAGNYWDRYRGYDLDRDGTGDVPFHPVRLFSVIVERHEPALVLLRSPLVDVLDAVERVLPVLTPDALVDTAPRMEPPEAPPEAAGTDAPVAAPPSA
jgi:nitrous oxidase accessory protein